MITFLHGTKDVNKEPLFFYECRAEILWCFTKRLCFKSPSIMQYENELISSIRPFSIFKQAGLHPAQTNLD